MTGSDGEPLDLTVVLERYELQQDKEDPNLISWREDAPSHPRNWSIARKLLDSGCILSFQLFTTGLGTAGTSLGSFARQDYNLTQTTGTVVFVLSYQIGRIVGGMVLPPLTETWGRRNAYIAASWLFAIFCVVAGVVPHIAGAVVGRFISGIMSSVGGAVGAGSMHDMFDIEARIFAIFAWIASSVVGLALGPIYSSYIASRIGWRWVLYIAAIVTFFLGILAFVIRESRASRLLKLNVDKMRQDTGCKDLYIVSPDNVKDFATFAQTTLQRPLRLLCTEPIVGAVVIMASVAWAMLFLFTESLTIIYELFGFTEVQTSLFFIPILIGVFLGVPIRLYDQRVLRRLSKEGKPVKPEDKIIGFAIAAPALAIGLWWFAWTTPQLVHTHWIVPTLALVPVGFAINEFDYVLAGYLADCYMSFASSAVASMLVVRSSLSGVFPIIGPFMYTGISTNAASSIVAGVATVFCIAPYVFIKYGERIRRRSSYATHLH